MHTKQKLKPKKEALKPLALIFLNFFIFFKYHTLLLAVRLSYLAGTPGSSKSLS